MSEKWKKLKKSWRFFFCVCVFFFFIMLSAAQWNKLLQLKYLLYGLPEFTMFNTVNELLPVSSVILILSDSSTFEGFFLIGNPGFSSLYIY